MIQRVYKFIITITLGGVLFLVPIGIITLILGKIYLLLKDLQIGLKLDLIGTTFLISLLNDLLIVFLLTILCFLSGLLSQSRLGTEITGWLEYNILSQVPGYNYLKASAEGLLGITEHNFKEVILIRLDDNFLLGFLVEAVSASKALVFIPDVPRPVSGTMIIVDTDRVIATQLTSKQAFSLMSKMGIGASVALKDLVSKNIL